MGKVDTRVKTRVKTRDRHADAERVFTLMRDGLSANQACKQSGFSLSSLLDWCKEDAALAEKYAHAREDLLDWQALDLERIGEEAAAAESAVTVQGLRLLSDNRKWLLSKLSPKKYGDRAQVDLTAKVTSVTQLTDEQLSAIATGRSA